jgi:Zn-finger protein
MKIKLLKDWIKDNGKTLKKDCELIVTQELGQQLIRQKKAVEDKQTNKLNINFETKEVKLPLTK